MARFVNGEGLGRRYFDESIDGACMREGREPLATRKPYTEFDLRNEFDMSTLYRFIELLYTRRLKTIPMYP